jgi:cyclophilin family peptidyl-prolyl cis-trans isomerase/HEAT repeat protein
VRALADNAPLVQGRAAQALGLIGDRDDIGRVAAMVRSHVEAGVLSGLDPDDLSYPLSPSIEAVRLGLYALARFGSYDWLAAAIIGSDGDPISRWWPVAYAFGRIPGEQAAPVLLRLLDTPGRYTAAFAAKGLANGPSLASVAALRNIVERRSVHPAVVVQAMRALGASGPAAVEAAPALIRVLSDRMASPMFRAEAAAAFGALADRGQRELLFDLLVETTPAVRAAAMRALARVDPDTFIAVLAGLDPDDDWTVRVAQAQALGTLPEARGLPRLRVMLDDEDVRVVPAVVAALAVAGGPAAEALVIARLTSADFVVRAAAATAVADLKATGAARLLADAYRAAAADDTYVARAAALTALNRVDRQAARSLLEEALRDRDWAVRVRAAALLNEQNPSAPDAVAVRPAAAGRPVADPDWQRIVMPRYTPLAYIETSKGTIELELAITDAPLTTENFVTLARAGVFDGRTIHRVVPDFVVQDGDPRGDGEGGPGYTIRDEINPRPYLRGTVGMALDWEDTGGSQFFITHSPQPHLDARYTAFGQVVTGMDVVDALVPGDLILRVRIWDGVNEP